jgi:hypothetical protein
MEAVFSKKRLVPRLPTALPVRLPDGWKGEVLNLSAHGVCIRTMALLQVESVLDAVIEHGGGEIAVRGTVVWADPPNFDLGDLGEIGLQLIDPSEEYLQLAAKLFADSAAP